MSRIEILRPGLFVDGAGLDAMHGLCGQPRNRGLATHPTRKATPRQVLSASRADAVHSGDNL
jgi:hypothetical protein